MPWMYVIEDFNDEEILGTVYEKELQNPDLTEFRVELKR